MIIATAGHVDHGKTKLIEAITGVNSDRLPEEKNRGMSIDLGFAYRDLGNGLILFLEDWVEWIEKMETYPTREDEIIDISKSTLTQVDARLAHLDLTDISNGKYGTSEICDKVRNKFRRILTK